MSSLADLPELVGFFSYSREDDEGSHGALSALRERIQHELRAQLGRSFKTFRLWQDKEAIAAGRLWEAEIKTAIGQSVFFVPIVTPTVVKSSYCQFELNSFLAREAELGRSDLVFPILYIGVPALSDAAAVKADPVLSLIAKRQYVDWREYRFRPPNSPEFMLAVERLCIQISEALRRSWTSVEERRRHEKGAIIEQKRESTDQSEAVEEKQPEAIDAVEHAIDAVEHDSDRIAEQHQLGHLVLKDRQIEREASAAVLARAQSARRQERQQIREDTPTPDTLPNSLLLVSALLIAQSLARIALFFSSLYLYTVTYSVIFWVSAVGLNLFLIGFGGLALSILLLLRIAPARVRIFAITFCAFALIYELYTTYAIIKGSYHYGFAIPWATWIWVVCCCIFVVGLIVFVRWRPLNLKSQPNTLG